MNLADIYSEDELNYDAELIYNQIRDDILGFDFTVSSMDPEGIAALLAPDGASTVLGTFDNFADREQRELVLDNVEDFDTERVVVVTGRTLIDGYHHVIAAHKTRRSVPFIDLAEAVAPDDMRPA
jgi:hypothetical protein